MPEHRSVSQINTYLQCGEAYRLKYVDKPPIPPMPAAWLAQGLAFHETIEAWEESGRSPLLDVSQTYLLAYDKHIMKMKEEQPDLNLWLKAPSKKTEQDILERRERGLKQVHGYVEFAQQNPFMIKEVDEFTLALEVPFAVVLGEVTIKGFIDQILAHPQGVEVRDLKTGNRESAKLQLGVYKVVVEKVFGWPVAAASFYYAKDSKVVALAKSELDRYTEEYVADMFAALDRGIRHRVFIPNPSSACMLCAVRKFCREFN